MKRKNIIHIYNKKNQKGRLHLHRRLGYFICKGNYSLYFKNSWILTNLQYKALKTSLSYFIPKYLYKSYNIIPERSTYKRQGMRMGKGKSKKDLSIYKYTKNNIFYEIYNKQKYNLPILNTYLKIYNRNIYYKYIFNKIIKKFPFLGIKFK